MSNSQQESEKKASYQELIKEIIRWVVLSVVLAIPIGLLVGGFNIILSKANDFRKEHEVMVYLLPLAGIAITFLYLKTRRNAYSGENVLKSEVQQAARDIPPYMVLVAGAGSLLTTLCGGSAGKEGAAVAMGGTLGDWVARKMKLSDEEQRTLVICGVGSAFGVIYNVPFAGAILGMEQVLKGKFHYQALIPAFLTTVIADEVASVIGNKAISYPTLELGDMTLLLIGKLVVLGVLFGIGGFVFNLVLDNSQKAYELVSKKPYVKAVLGGVITIVLFWLVGDNYNGLGQSFIQDAFQTEVTLMDSVWKILFTAVALGSGFMGGRGNPTFFVGAALGSCVAGLMGLPLAACTALGMIGVFCAATSLPITAIAMSLEYFGGGEMVAIMVVMTVSYIISGFYDVMANGKIPKEKEKIFSGKVRG